MASEPRHSLRPRCRSFFSSDKSRRRKAKKATDRIKKEMTENDEASKYLRGVVDFGSNGIRFSITDLKPETARILPTLFTDRAGIALYNSQFKGTTKSPISDEVIDEILISLRRFQQVCRDFGVPEDSVRVVATEATREAQNSQEFRDAILEVTGWEVEMLSKEEEGKVGALGIASSFTEVHGLVMDLGGGSTQLSWLVSKDGHLRMAPKAVSMPFGAAALTKKLSTAIDSKAVDNVRTTIIEAIKEALTVIDVPPELDIDGEGCDLYLSGGGFRGFGYLMLSEHEIQPYPIPIINGFTTTGEAVREYAQKLQGSSTDKKAGYMTAESMPDDLLVELEGTFRISGNRAQQVPAVSFLMNAMLTALPEIRNVIFCQGGVREGCLYQTLDFDTRSQHPLTVATIPFRPPSWAALHNTIRNGLPQSCPDIIYNIILPALANLLCHHTPVPKESRAASALHFTTTGALSSTHGLSHHVRILLALALCQRWGGDVHEASLRSKMEHIVGAQNAWWARYLGAVAAAVGTVYPAGVIQEERVRLFAQDDAKNKKGDEPPVSLLVHRKPDDPSAQAVTVLKGFEKIEKVGKRKQCEELGYRKKIVVRIVDDL